MEVRSMRYAQVRSMDISNGEGIGVSLFVQGCPFNPHCYNCFNTETWDFNGGKEWTQEVKERFLELIDRSYIKRVSILGGETLARENLDGVLDIVIEITSYLLCKIFCKFGANLSGFNKPSSLKGWHSSHRNPLYSHIDLFGNERRLSSEFLSSEMPILCGFAESTF